MTAPVIYVEAYAIVTLIVSLLIFCTLVVNLVYFQEFKDIYDLYKIKMWSMEIDTIYAIMITLSVLTGILIFYSVFILLYNSKYHMQIVNAEAEVINEVRHITASSSVFTTDSTQSIKYSDDYIKYPLTSGSSKKDTSIIDKT